MIVAVLSMANIFSKSANLVQCAQQIVQDGQESLVVRRQWGRRERLAFDKNVGLLSKLYGL
jgi:hypothetical protein